MDTLHLESVRQDETISFSLSGRFDFKTRHLFKDALADALTNDEIRTIELRLDNLHYLDSSALGVLLKLWSEAQGQQKVMRILNPRGVVAQALDIAQFNKLFDIVSA